MSSTELQGIKTTKDCLQLQEDLHRLAEWEDKWGKCFRPEKCSFLRVTIARSPVLHSYTLKGQILHTDEQSKYLGVDITSNLSWNPHIDRIVKKGNSMLGFLQWNLLVNSCETKASAYFTLVRLNLEYCSNVWSPYTIQAKKRIEMVQREQQDMLQIDIGTQAAFQTCWRTSTGIHLKQEEPSHNDV